MANFGYLWTDGYSTIAVENCKHLLDQVKEFKAAYATGQDFEPCPPRILFTTDDREVTKTETTPTQDVQQ